MIKIKVQAQVTQLACIFAHIGSRVWPSIGFGVNALPCQVDLSAKNLSFSPWQKQSEEFDFSAEDRVPDMELNRILWYGLKGDAIAMPMPVRAAFVKYEPGDEKED